ncbi:MAG: GNAT family N-acetyltransferase [Oscillospiraceae bacterium]|jgi:GNAT superfamily N-acetyltransferase
MNAANARFLRERRDPLQIKTVTGENAALFETFLPDVGRDTQPGGRYAAFGAELYGEPCGALEMKIGTGNCDITALFVAENSRRSGVGTRLLIAAKRFAAERDIDKIYVEFLLDKDEQTAVEAFFSACGFYLVESGNSIYTFALSDIPKSEEITKLSGTTQPAGLLDMSSLPPKVLASMQRQAGSTFAAELAPWNAKGKIIADLSPGVYEDNHVCCFIIVTALNGQLYLNSAYTDKSHSRLFSSLLTQTLLLAAEKYSEYGKMCVTAATPASQRLVEKLSGDLLDKVDKKTVRAMCWSLADELNASAAEERLAPTQAWDGLEVLTPKLMRLMDFLRDEDRNCELMLAELPYILVSVGDANPMIAYVPVEDNFDRLDLTFTARVPDGGDPARLNAENRLSTVFQADGELFLRYTLPESGLPVTAEQFSAVMESLERELVFHL